MFNKVNFKITKSSRFIGMTLAVLVVAVAGVLIYPVVTAVPPAPAKHVGLLPPQQLSILEKISKYMLASVSGSNIILISGANELDSNRNVIVDVYSQASVQDGNYITIPNGNYVRATFERALTNQNDVTLYVKGTGTVEVYKKDSTDLIMSFAINGESKYRQLLTNMKGTSDSFDLKSVGDISYDFITDPTNTETLRPNGAGSETAIPTQYPSSTSHWDKVDEVTADGLSTYVTNASSVSWLRDLYAMSDHVTGSGTINSVTVYAITSDGSYCAADTEISIRTHNTTYDTGANWYVCSGNWVTASNVWTTNPNTSSAWTWAEVDALEAGISLYHTTGGFNSILPGQPILMADGSQKNIEDIRAGDEIISFNLNSGKTEKDTITSATQGNHPDYLVFNGTLKTSLDHVIWVNGGFKPAKDIKLGDFLLNSQGQKVEVTQIEYFPETVLTYDLEVQNNHNFFVNNYLVHNPTTNGVATQVYAVVDYTPAASTPRTIGTGISIGSGVVINSVYVAPVWACGSTLVDSRDSQSYATVQIGTQCWMRQNLNVGVRVAGSATQTTSCSSIQKYCYGDTDGGCTRNTSTGTDGGFYQWDQTMCGSASCNGTGSSQPACTTPVQGICPTGWHVPSHYEWNLLELTVCAINPTDASCAAQFPYNTTTQNGQGTSTETVGTKLQIQDATHFSALLPGSNVYFWTSLASWDRVLIPGYFQVVRGTNSTLNGFSVRCLKN